ncbi:Aspartokinase [Boothiomyces macroporosus]|uniref:Aspartokinase n=1 Tax=Boothiomyces macroporosus TaxID=261099 RepID=A0AAD5Y902_9FUNG|nr:Aspartokinase [Boothiomyces macroporosus]
MTEKIVLKYGGTSVGSGERLVHVAKVVKNIKETTTPIVVLSAMSGTKKSEGTTSRLLEAVQEILKPQSQRYLHIVDMIENSHLEAAIFALGNSENKQILEDLENDIRGECQKLRSFMAAAEIIDEISPKSKDVIVSMGEKLSARLFTAVLNDQGVAAKYINLDKLITKQFDASELDQSFYDYLSLRLAEEIVPYMNTHVCVVTGFFGPCPGSLLNTVGRGYTDLTAALIAVGIQAAELQIWKEVDGIFTADPRKVPRAKKLRYISPEEAAELTYYGSEVIHPFTMEQVIRACIPIRIKNTFNPDGSGTLIIPEGHPMTPTTSSASLSNAFSRHPTAVTIKDHVIVLNVHSNRRSVSHGFLAQTFLILDQFNIVVDLISTSEVHVSMAIGKIESEEKLQKAIENIKKFATVIIINLGRFTA